jgi:hypothetical protein
MSTRKFPLVAMLSAAVALCIGVVGCGGQDTEPSTSEAVPGGARSGDSSERPPVFAPVLAETGARISCPASINPDGQRGTCTLAYEQVALDQCEGKGGGGFDVAASGIPCTEARQLRYTLGSLGFSSYRRRGEGVYRPWLASGKYTNPKPIEALGWTCWHQWNPKAGTGIQYVCWKGQATVLFKTG